MDAKEKKGPAPPYVAYRTLANFLDKFKQGLPGRIDRGLMGTMSGAAQSQVTTALRYLGMISENNVPTQLMKNYVSGEEDERRAALRKMLEDSYPFAFGAQLDLGSATASQLKEAFDTHTSATGETLGRCIAFFKDAAKDAGISISPFILAKKARTPGVKRKTGPKRDEGSRPAAPQGGTPVHHTAAAPQMPAQSSLLLSGLFQRLPRPGAVWAKAEREQWVQTLQNVLVMEYPESGTS